MITSIEKLDEIRFRLTLKSDTATKRRTITARTAKELTDGIDRFRQNAADGRA